MSDKESQEMKELRRIVEGDDKIKQMKFNFSDGETIIIDNPIVLEELKILIKKRLDKAP